MGRRRRGNVVIKKPNRFKASVKWPPDPKFQRLSAKLFQPYQSHCPELNSVKWQKYPHISPYWQNHPTGYQSLGNTYLISHWSYHLALIWKEGHVLISHASGLPVKTFKSRFHHFIILQYYHFPKYHITTVLSIYIYIYG